MVGWSGMDRANTERGSSPDGVDAEFNQLYPSSEEIRR
jgi:hypothetical protein